MGGLCFKGFVIHRVDVCVHRHKIVFLACSTVLVREEVAGVFKAGAFSFQSILRLLVAQLGVFRRLVSFCLPVDDTSGRVCAVFRAVRAIVDCVGLQGRVWTS